MAFSKFTIKNYKCFQDEQTLQFAIPKIDDIGSGITYIVGVNNSGKTTLIEGLSIRGDRNIKSSERLDGADPEFYLYDNNNTLVRKIVLLRPESSSIKEDPKLPNDQTFEIISSRRQWSSNANSKYANVGQGFTSVLDFTNRNNSLDVGSELRAIEENDEKYKEFICLVQRVIPEFTKFAVNFEDNHFIEYISNSGVRHKTDLLGDGVITAIRILLQLFVAKPNAIIIDEPELSLHPSAQRRLLNVLAEYSQKRQIVICTHSPYMLNWEFLKNGATVNRVVKENDKHSTVSTITDFNKYKGLINGENWKQPFVMDSVAKEIFFMEDGVLFLEGQEDVGLLRQEAGLAGINIFGYGVRGVGNFKFALSLAKDLGYKKVSCILDFGEKENTIRNDLQATFPDYKIVQWNKNDIRDKEAKTSKEKNGYFDKDGNKKSEEHLDDYIEKISEIKTYIK